MEKKIAPTSVILVAVGNFDTLDFKLDDQLGIPCGYENHSKITLISKSVSLKKIGEAMIQPPMAIELCQCCNTC
jgi:hypothetical protein